MDGPMKYIPNPGLPPIQDWQKEIAAAILSRQSKLLIEELDRHIQDPALKATPIKLPGLDIKGVYVDEHMSFTDLVKAIAKEEGEKEATKEFVELMVGDLTNDLKAIEMVQTGQYSPKHAKKKTPHQRAVERRKKRRNGGHK